MIIKMLVENTTINPKLHSAHGLCIYIETNKHKILFDVGPNDFFIENASFLGVNLSSIDTVIISHGHIDHGGGLKSFLNINSKAKIYVQDNVFTKHYSKRIDKISDISLLKDIENSKQIVFVKDYLRIDDELELFSDVPNNHFMPSDNNELLHEKLNELECDDFSHEQNLIIRNKNKTVLLSGCAHRGILNIMDKAIEIIKTSPDYVIGGFHLYSGSRKKCEDVRKINQIAINLKDLKTQFYTCHCTGIKPYEMLKDIMGEKIKYISTGDEIII